MPNHIPFARNREGRLVDVHSVPRGLACGCVCPECDGRIVANQGNVNSWYFSHASGSECAGGAETALHLAAKQLILTHRRVALPPFVIQFRREHPSFGLYQRSRDVTLPERIWQLVQARAESRIGTGPYIADIGGRLGDVSDVVVEVKVRHEVEHEKAHYLRANRLPCIEIDLLPLLGKQLTLQELAWHVLDCDTNRTWVNHNEYSSIKAEMLAEYEAWVACRTRNAAEAARPRKAPPPPQPSKTDLANARYRELPDEMKRLELRTVLGLKPAATWPRHLQVPVREGAGAIPAPLDIWQGAVFVQFIYDPIGDGPARRPFSLPQVFQWAGSRFGVSEEVKYNAATALRLFLGYLTSCGFLERYRDEYGSDTYTVLHGALQPPARREPMGPSRTTYPLTVRPTTGAPRTSAATARRGWTWREKWPPEDAALERASEASTRYEGAAFNARRFIDALYRMTSEPSPSAIETLLTHCGGNPKRTFELLKDIGVVEESWRTLRDGIDRPWR